MKRRLNISSLLNKDDEELEKNTRKIYYTEEGKKCRKRTAREIERKRDTEK